MRALVGVGKLGMLGFPPVLVIYSSRTSSGFVARLALDCFERHFRCTKMDLVLRVLGTTFSAEAAVVAAVVVAVEMIAEKDLPLALAVESVTAPDLLRSEPPTRHVCARPGRKTVARIEPSLTGAGRSPPPELVSSPREYRKDLAALRALGCSLLQLSLLRSSRCRDMMARALILTDGYRRIQRFGCPGQLHCARCWERE